MDFLTARHLSEMTVVRILNMETINWA